MSSKYLTIQEAAELIGKSTQTLRRFIKTGKLKARRRRTPQGFNYVLDRDSLMESFEAKEPVVSTPMVESVPMEPIVEPVKEIEKEEVVHPVKKVEAPVKEPVLRPYEDVKSPDDEIFYVEKPAKETVVEKVVEKIVEKSDIDSMAVVEKLVDVMGRMMERNADESARMRVEMEGLKEDLRDLEVEFRVMEGLRSVDRDSDSGSRSFADWVRGI